MNDSAFLELCARVLDGRPSATDIRRWNNRLSTDSRQRALYRDFCGQQVRLEEELAGARVAAGAARPVQPLVSAGRLAAAAALLVTAGAWWWNRSELLHHDQPAQVGMAASAVESSTGAPSAFTYPFDGFPNLQPESAESNPQTELRVVALDEIDPRIITIAQRLAGFDFSSLPEL